MSKQAFTPNKDVYSNFIVKGTYDTNDPNLGFTNVYQNLTCAQATAQNWIVKNNGFPDWLSPINNQIDLRAIYVQCCGTNNANYCTQFPSQWTNTQPFVPTHSDISGTKVAFTTESIFYAQSGYFVTIVMVQWSNVFACKSRKVFILLFR